MYKTNKLGIPYDGSAVEGHSIYSHKIYKSISYYRVFRSRNPYTDNLYGIFILKHENK